MSTCASTLSLSSPNVHYSLAVPWLDIVSLPGTSSSNFRSVHRFWDGQLALRRVLRETLNSGVPPKELHDVIDAILIKVDHLEMHHGDDWYCWWELHFSIRNSSALPEKKPCMTAVREAYHWIQQWWEKRQR
jgi:hypothetical protein